jgi:hypothetical protein
VPEKSFWQTDWWKPLAVAATLSAVIAWVRLGVHLDGHPFTVKDRLEQLHRDQISISHEIANLQWRLNILEEFRLQLKPADDIAEPLEEEIDRLRKEIEMMKKRDLQIPGGH